MVDFQFSHRFEMTEVPMREKVTGKSKLLMKITGGSVLSYMINRIIPP